MSGAAAPVPPVRSSALTAGSGTSGPNLVTVALSVALLDSASPRRGSDGVHGRGAPASELVERHDLEAVAGPRAAGVPVFVMVGGAMASTPPQNAVLGAISGGRR